MQNTKYVKDEKMFKKKKKVDKSNKNKKKKKNSNKLIVYEVMTQCHKLLIKNKKKEK